MRKNEVNLKGIVACPTCGKGFIFAYSDSKGHASMPCPKCRRIIMVDYETLEATLIPPKRKSR